MLLGYEILWLKFFGSTMPNGPAPILLPLIFFGGSLGALVLALSRERADGGRSAGWVARHTHELAGAGLLLAFASVPFWRTEPGPGLSAAPPILAFAASVLWGIAQTALVRGSSRPVLMISAGAAGAVPLILLPILLNHFPLAAVAPVFAASQILLLCVLTAGCRPVYQTAFLALTAAGMLVSQNSAPPGGTYSNAIATLRVQKSAGPAREPDSEPSTISEFHHASPYSFENFRIYRNGRHVTDLIDAADLSETGQLKQDELFHYIESVNPGRAAIVGPGGGRDILYTRLAGFGRIDAIEINPDMVRAVRENSRNPQLTYEAPEVNTIIADGRDYFRRLAPDQIFDLILLSDVRNYGSTLSMHFAENYLFTEEAIASYVRHLAPGGLLLYRMNGRDNTYVGAHFESAVNTLKNLPTGPADELAVTRRHKGKNSRWNGFILALKKDGFRPADKAGIEDHFTKRGQNVRFLSPSHESLPPANRLTDDRPYPHWIGGAIHVTGAALIVLLGLAAFGLLSLPASGARNLLSAAFLCGFTFVAVQVLAIEQGVFQSGDPFTAPPLIMAAALLFTSCGYAFSKNARPHDFLTAAITLIIAFALIKTIGHWPLGNLARASAAAALTAAPFFYGARAYSRLLQSAHDQRLTAAFIAANGLGMLLGGLGSKLIQAEAGAAALVLVCAITYIFARQQSANS